MESKDAPSASRDTVHVLVIDDEELMLRLCERILEHADHRVSTTSSAEEALDLVQREDFDLVVCDMLMPELEGDQLVEQIRRAQQSLPVVFISGHTIDSQALEHVEVGEEARFLHKPFRADELLEAVSDLVP